MHESDKHLWTAFLQGDAQAFARIYNMFHADLYYYALKLTQQRELAEDAVQDTFTYAWQNRDHLREAVSPKFYLLRSVRNQCLKLIQHQHQLASLDESQTRVEFVLRPEELKLKDPSSEVRIVIERALNELSPRQREIIYLKYYDNLDYQEISQLSGMNYQSVVNLMHRAIVKLRTADLFKHLNLL